MAKSTMTINLTYSAANNPRAAHASLDATVLVDRRPFLRRSWSDAHPPCITNGGCSCIPAVLDTLRVPPALRPLQLIEEDLAFHSVLYTHWSRAAGTNHAHRTLLAAHFAADPGQCVLCGTPGLTCTGRWLRHLLCCHPDLLIRIVAINRACLVVSVCHVHRRPSQDTPPPLQSPPLEGSGVTWPRRSKLKRSLSSSSPSAMGPSSVHPDLRYAVASCPELALEALTAPTSPLASDVQLAASVRAMENDKAVVVMMMQRWNALRRAMAIGAPPPWRPAWDAPAVPFYLVASVVVPPLPVGGVGEFEASLVDAALQVLAAALAAAAAVEGGGAFTTITAVTAALTCLGQLRGLPVQQR
ncbi:hypothetical protein BC828DRAFT_380849 [Blastocladiella britannica]|nr:hypothetical protein BC828DRAFT_380849 [Blastocladiella britannica]